MEILLQPAYSLLSENLRADLQKRLDMSLNYNGPFVLDFTPS